MRTRDSLYTLHCSQYCNMLPFHIPLPFLGNSVYVSFKLYSPLSTSSSSFSLSFSFPLLLFSLVISLLDAFCFSSLSCGDLMSNYYLLESSSSQCGFEPWRFYFIYLTSALFGIQGSFNYGGVSPNFLNFFRVLNRMELLISHELTIDDSVIFIFFSLTNSKITGKLFHYNLMVKRVMYTWIYGPLSFLVLEISTFRY